MTWIRSIEYQQSDGKLRSIYDRIKGPHDQLDNILKAHGLRPHTLEGHLLLYKNVKRSRMRGVAIPMQHRYIAKWQRSVYALPKGLTHLLFSADIIGHCVMEKRHSSTFQEAMTKLNMKMPCHASSDDTIVDEPNALERPP